MLYPVVRLKTSAWKDSRNNLHLKKSLIFLRRKYVGLLFNIFEEDITQLGADHVMDKVININSCDDGIYMVVMRNIHRDSETGTIDEYDYRLEHMSS